MTSASAIAGWSQFLYELIAPFGTRFLRANLKGEAGGTPRLQKRVGLYEVLAQCCVDVVGFADVEPFTRIREAVDS